MDNPLDELAAMNEQAAGATHGLPLVTYAQARLQIDAPYLIKGWFLAGELSATTGAPGCGKTFMALDIDSHIAAGVDWFGHRVRQTAVVYLAAEGGTAIFNRIGAIKQRLGYDDSLPLAIIPAGIDLVSGEAGAAALVTAIQRAEATFSRPVGKVTVDTVSRVLCGADENSSEAMGGLVRAVDAIRAATNAHLTLVHHTPKDGTRGKGGRGHSSLWGALDAEIGVDRDPVTKIATATVLKQRNAEEGATVSFDLDIVQLGTDQDGDAVSSCVIRAATAPKPAADAKMSAACSLAMSALRLAISEGGQPVPTSRYTPDNAVGVPVDLWRKFAYERSISGDGTTQDAKRKAFDRAAKQLHARNLVGIWNDWVWIP
jgi:AAA domain